MISGEKGFLEVAKGGPAVGVVLRQPGDAVQFEPDPGPIAPLAGFPNRGGQKKGLPGRQARSGGRVMAGDLRRGSIFQQGVDTGPANPGPVKRAVRGRVGPLKDPALLAAIPTIDSQPFGTSAGGPSADLQLNRAPEKSSVGQEADRSSAYG